MNSSWMFIGKLLILSGVLAVAIKYLLPFVPLPATATIAWLLVLTPTIGVAIALWLRSQSRNSQNSTPQATSK